MARDWAEACGLDAGLTEHLAHAICVETVDWPRQLTDAVGSQTRWVVDLGPAELSANMTGRALRGRGVTVVPAATVCGSRPALHLRRLRARGGRLVDVRPQADRPRRRQARRRHRVHPAHRQVADPARRDDPDHRRPRDRRRGRERRPLGRARRWRPGHRGDLRQERGEADRAARRGPHGAVQHAPARPLPVEAARRRPAPAAEGAPRRCSVRRPGDQRRHPRARGRRRHHRGPARGRHHPRRVQARHRQADPHGARDRPRGRHHRRHAHRGRRRRRAPLVGGPRRAPARDVRRPALASTTSSSASVAGSVRRTAPSTTSPAPGRPRTARPPCPSTAC